MPTANREDYVLAQLKKLQDIITEVYEGEESFLIPPDYIEVRTMIETISANHSADMNALSKMNAVYRRNRVMKKMKEKYREFFSYENALKKICQDADNSIGWSGAWETYIAYAAEQGYSDKDIEDYLESIDIFNDADDPSESDDDPDDDCEEDGYDLPF